MVPRTDKAPPVLSGALKGVYQVAVTALAGCLADSAELVKPSHPGSTLGALYRSRRTFNREPLAHMSRIGKDQPPRLPRHCDQTPGRQGYPLAWDPPLTAPRASIVNRPGYLSECPRSPHDSVPSHEPLSAPSHPTDCGTTPDAVAPIECDPSNPFSGP